MKALKKQFVMTVLSCCVLTTCGRKQKSLNAVHTVIRTQHTVIRTQLCFSALKNVPKQGLNLQVNCKYNLLKLSNPQIIY